MSKYKAKRTEVDGIVFDSMKEARRYQELKLLVRAGEIEDLELQPEFPLTVRVGQLNKLLGIYRADFSYTERGIPITEDCKGFKTPLYRWKKKHVEAQYGIQIRET